MTVRSKRLFGPKLLPTANAWTSLYTVPANRVARLSLVSVAAGGAATINLGLNDGTGWNQFFIEALVAGQTREPARGLVAEEGIQIGYFVTVANVILVGAYGSLLAGDFA